MQFDAAEGGEAGHGIATVDGVACVGNVFKPQAQVEVAPHGGVEFEVERGPALAVVVVGHIETSRSLDIGIDAQPLQRFPCRSDKILVARSTNKVVERGVEITVGGIERQPVGMAVLSRGFDAFVDEAVSYTHLTLPTTDVV